MNRSATVERAELRFKQMCCEAANGPLIAPMLFRELHAVLPFASCLYMWLGPTGPVDAYFNVPEVGQYLPLYADQYFSRIETEVWASTDEAALREIGPRLLPQVLRVSEAAYFRHPVYNEILLPSNVHTFIRFLVRDNGRPVGTFSISRGPHDRDFNLADLQTMQRLEPFIVHALAMRKEVPLSDVVEENAAMLIVDTSGRMLSLSPSAKTLLSMSQGSALAPAVLHEGLMRTVQALTEVARGERSAPVPAWSVDNAWGRFRARTYWLEQKQSAESHIGIFLERKVPRHLQLLEGLHSLSLPIRQEQVGLLLALGRSEEQAARELGLSRNTVIYHRRQIYNRLEIDSRALLVERLRKAAHEPRLV